MRYFIGYIVTIGLLIALILFLVTSSGGGCKSKTPTAPKMLNSYAFTDAQVRLTIDGPINADQTHQQVQITVSAFESTFQQIQGYDGTVVKAQSYYNTQNSYYAFLSALMQASFTRGTIPPGLSHDTGFCPLGDRYDIELVQDGQQLEHYWITSCGGTSTFKGNFPLTLSLFQAQIPNYGTLTGGLNL
jgi:hypothetical protein